MFALVDCNNFFVSCERVFRPDLNGKPVVVLSNNDGCVISRSNEAKALGIQMAAPEFQVKKEIRKYRIQVFSSNYTLYGDMSHRVMSILSSFAPETEVYSIDECFLNFSGMDHFDLRQYGLYMKQTVSQWTKIPVSIGIGPTKTLAKVANKFAKRYPAYQGVCIIDNDEKRIKALKLTGIGDVWGIGRRNAAKLNREGVTNAYEFTQLTPSFVREKMTVVGERLWRELRGESCLPLELVPSRKKEICTSRSFGDMLTTLEQLREPIASYASICAQKLRKQHSYARSLMVFIHTNQFREQDSQYGVSYTIELPVATNSTPIIVEYALRALKSIYRPGYKYKKAGVIILDIVTGNDVQYNMYFKYDYQKHEKLMQVLDKVNSGFNRNLVKLAAQGVENCKGNPQGHTSWNIRREHLSPSYTTDISDIMSLNCRDPEIE